MSGRPTDLPDWATNPNFAAGVLEWSGQPNKLKPSAGKIAEGFDPDEDFYVEWLNWIENNHGQWISFLGTTRGGPQFGDGSDGAATLDGTAAAPVWATKSGSVYTMTRDCYATTVLVTGAGVILNTNGYRIFANTSVTCTAGGTINNNGADGTSLLPGAAGNNGFFKGGAAGGASGTPGSNGGDVLGISCGGSGGAGGNSGAGTVAGTPGNNIPQDSSGHQHLYAALTFGCAFDGTSTFTPLAGGSGGGGGGDSGADGGCGGAGGGVVAIATPSLFLDFATDVSARGGNGGTADNGGTSGGGGGGGGGSIHLACCDITIGSGTLSTAANCAGGVGGGHSNGGGFNGVNGNDGKLFVFSTDTSAPLSVGSTAHQENGFSAVTTGAGAGHEYVDFTWSQPFAAATGASGYNVEGQISLTTDGDPIPTYAITNKTATGFRVRFPAGGFNGEFRWSAK